MKLKQREKSEKKETEEAPAQTSPKQSLVQENTTVQCGNAPPCQARVPSSIHLIVKFGSKFRISDLNIWISRKNEKN